jgi:hypothetical protein
MNTTKLKEAVIELQRQRAILDSAIQQIQKVLATLNGDQESTGDRVQLITLPGTLFELGLYILESAGKPMHIKEIVKKVSEMRHKTIPRGSLESGFLRHIKNEGQKAKLRRVSPGVFALTIWPQSTLDLTSKEI